MYYQTNNVRYLTEQVLKNDEFEAAQTTTSIILSVDVNRAGSKCMYSVIV